MWTKIKKIIALLVITFSLTLLSISKNAFAQTVPDPDPVTALMYYGVYAAFELFGLSQSGEDFEYHDCSEWQSDRFYTGDFIGDGKPAFAYTYLQNNSWTVDVQTFNGSDFNISTWAAQQGAYNQYQSWLIGDFNGDGKVDFAKFWSDNGLWTADVHLSTGSGFAMSRWATQQGYVINSQNCSPTIPSVQLSCLIGDGSCNSTGYNSCSPTTYWVVGDFNGDGKTDFMKFWNDGGSWSAEGHLSTGSGFNMSTWALKLNSFIDGNWYIGDFNGDGKSDIARIYNDSMHNTVNIDVYTSTGNAFTVSRWATQNAIHAGQSWLIGDFNGDGKSDLATYWNDNGYWSIDVYLSSGNSFIYSSWVKQQGIINNSQFWVAGDFTGDSKMDLLKYWNDNGYWSADVYQSSGSAFVMSRWATQQSAFGGDLSGGGCQTTTTVNNYVSSEPQLSQLVCGNQYVYIGGYLKGDFNGDGKMDIVNHWLDSSSGQWKTALHLSTGSKFVDNQGAVVAPLLVPILMNILN